MKRRLRVVESERSRNFRAAFSEGVDLARCRADEFKQARDARRVRAVFELLRSAFVSAAAIVLGRWGWALVLLYLVMATVLVAMKPREEES